MNNGYIKLWRKILEWEWHSDPHTAYLFIYLLCKANYKDSKFQGKEIKRGQLVFGRRQASKETGISEQSIRSSINRLKSTQEITQESTHQFSLLTIVNYDLYQSDEEKSTQESTQQSTTDQPTINHVLRSKEVKNKPKDIVVKEIPPPLETVKEFFHNDEMATNFWDYYASKGWLVGKSPMKDWKAAARRWQRQNNGFIPSFTQRKEYHAPRGQGTPSVG